MKPKLKELLTASFEFEEYNPYQTRVLILNAMFFIAIVVNTIFLLINFFITETYFLVWVNLAIIAFLGFALYRLRQKDHYDFAVYVGNITLFIAFVFIAVLKQSEHYSLVWTYFFTPFAILTLGARKGLLLSLLFIVTVMAITASGIWVWDRGEWNLETFFRFSLAHFIMLYLLYAVQNSTELANEKIETMRNKEKRQLRLLEKLSITDTLTSLYNRRFFDEIFPKQIAKAEDHKGLLVFFTLDLDHFKQYNDTYGHQKGDWALMQFADVFKDAFDKKEDYVFRMGGEEFACLFLEYTNERVYKRIDLLMQKLRDRSIEHRGKTPKGILSCSIGVYIKKPYDNREHQEIYRLADEALYRAKAEGRNRVVYV